MIIAHLQLLGEPGTGGSSTPSMVGAVKKWQKADPQKSLDTWKTLSEANSELEKQLSTLSKLAEKQWDEYKSTINCCSLLKPEKVFWFFVLKLVEETEEIRFLFFLISIQNLNIKNIFYIFIKFARFCLL